MIGGIFIFLFYLAIVLFIHPAEPAEEDGEYSLRADPEVGKDDIVYKGATNAISINEIESILEKRYSYYVSLQVELKEVFLSRTQNFMAKKIFIIKNDEGFKEMPVLVSAAAVQLTLGLKDFLLPFFRYIRIYPQEYLSDDSFKILAGNVENNVITIAWNQFLKGYNDLTDGSNVGLHEMSHALYFQKLIIDSDYAKDFSRSYNSLLTECRTAYQTELSGQRNLYSPYADTDLQEFWAESVEIFFEKPLELKTQYRSVFESMKTLLNQDPLNKSCPVINTDSSLSQRLQKFLVTTRDKEQ